MKILKASFKNYKGLHKVSVGGIYKISIPSHTNIHSVFGENGMGKSTLVSNLNPFIFPNGFTGKSNSDFVNFPAFKKLVFELGNIEYKSDIQFTSKTQTKCKLYKKVVGEWEVVAGFESGKATTYSDLIEKLFGTSQKNIMMVNYIGQNTNAIIEANPKTRRELIAPLIGSLDEHNATVIKYEALEKDGKAQILHLKGEIAGINSKLGTDKLEDLPDEKDIEGIETKIDLTKGRMDIITARGKEYRKKHDEYMSNKANVDKIQASMFEIKENDIYPDFPNEIKVGADGRNLKDLKKERDLINTENASKEKGRILVEKSLSGLKAKYESSIEFNNGLLSNHEEKEILEFDELDKKINQVNLSLNKNRGELERLKKLQVVFDKNEEIKGQIKDIEKNISKDLGDKENIKGKLTVILEKIYDVSRDVDQKVEEFVQAIISQIDNENHTHTITDTYAEIFGQPLKASKSEKDALVKVLLGKKTILEGELQAIEKNDFQKENVFTLRKKLFAENKDKSDDIAGVVTQIEEEVSELGGMSGRKYLVDARLTYIINAKFIKEYDDTYAVEADKLKGYKAVDTSEIQGLIDKAEKVEGIQRANVLRVKYCTYGEESGKWVRINLGGESIDKIKAVLDECESSYIELGKNNTGYQSELVKIKVGYQKRITMVSVEDKLKDTQGELDAVVLQNKVYNAIKLYTKNIKETVISLFMVNITNLANQYLAMDESSSIRINLSIEQKGQNFNINAKQDGFEIQEVSTLSGAEKSTVNRALATAIAFSKVKSKYGNYSFDEADSALSQSNKLAFAKNIKDIADHDMVEQLFIISHDNGITDYLDANKIVMGENT